MEGRDRGIGNKRRSKEMEMMVVKMGTKGTWGKRKNGREEGKERSKAKERGR